MQAEVWAWKERLSMARTKMGNLVAASGYVP